MPANVNRKKLANKKAGKLRVPLNLPSGNINHHSPNTYSKIENHNTTPLRPS